MAALDPTQKLAFKRLKETVDLGDAEAMDEVLRTRMYVILMTFAPQSGADVLSIIGDALKSIIVGVHPLLPV
jgi:hypothetical protein